jgi:hypothetical protein
MLARRVLALAVVSSTLSACGLLVGVEPLSVDPAADSSIPVIDGAVVADVRDDRADRSIDDASVADVADASRTWRRVFLTSMGLASSGMMNGTVGADNRCALAALNASLGGGPWVAWLSGDGRNAIDQIPDVAGREYRLVDGITVVAKTRSQLVSGGLEHAIDRMENGQLASSNQPIVWTGTLSSGLASVHNCTNWTTATGNPGIQGLAGSFDKLSRHWTENDGPGFGLQGFTCNSTARLYCFEK